jgi:hypothetical protein
VLPPAVGPWTAVPLMPLGRSCPSADAEAAAVNCRVLGWRRPPKRSMLEEGLLGKEISVIILGIILIVVGLLVASLKFLLWVGIVLLVVGLVLNFVSIGGRRRRIF